jgi:sterol desaturase/sphingolipid hydroxylase (fatty acid hydroxylase superfamily)
MMPDQTLAATSVPFRVDLLDGTEGLLQRVVFWALQPALIVAVLAAWSVAPTSALLYPLILVGVQIVLGALEYLIPARPDWHQAAREKFGLIGIALLTVIVGDLASTWEYALLAAPLEAWREALQLDVWPHTWPLIAQALLAFFASELILYWIHRAEHRWLLVWRLSGHGAHHAFKKLNAINSGANHPLELFWIVVPALIVELLFGVGAAMFGSLMLAITQAAIVHSNLKLNARGIGVLFTTNAFHVRHHSADFDERNTNFGCSAIVWDRLFGTFAHSGVAEAGTGAREPTTLEKLLMPVREPAGTVTAPGNSA